MLIVYPYNYAVFDKCSYLPLFWLLETREEEVFFFVEHSWFCFSISGLISRQKYVNNQEYNKSMMKY